MSELIAACTPNSHPKDGEFLAAINLPDWESLQDVAARPPLPADAGFAPTRSRLLRLGRLRVAATRPRC
ncbi:hypothetical protein San01_13140 [Streptomyces angustmyceticus]|uniref:Uncharacterized protein n=1 Tax=Streptomyces angustmyceticus TaxID=285578 RepID=A0A5J4L370_9ACTN|nr:hypothetical protein San01_13140 [Streptomyces angustmyceticus]